MLEKRRRSRPRRRGSSYLATESPFLAAGYHITYHFGLYLYQFLDQLFLRCISPCPPYNINFFWRLCHKRMPSRHDEKGGDGMSISASSVTLAAWSSSSVKSNTGPTGTGVFGARMISGGGHRSRSAPAPLGTEQGRPCRDPGKAAPATPSDIP